MSTTTVVLVDQDEGNTSVPFVTGKEGSDTNGERRRGRRSDDQLSCQKAHDNASGFFAKSASRGVLVTIREHAIKQSSRERALLLGGYWRVIILGLVFQWVHSIAANVAYYLHEPRDTLPDIGFRVIPELGPELQWISEAAFFTFFISTILFGFSPLFIQYQRPKFATAIVARFLGVCTLAQTLRIICFLVTSLPGPNYHCRPYSAEYNPPKDVLAILFNADPFKHCGDLVFSSHTIFVMLCACTWNKYGPEFIGKKALCCCCLVFGTLVVAARKHYSLDVVVAMWTVPLLWIAYDQYYPDKLPEFSDMHQLTLHEKEKSLSLSLSLSCRPDSSNHLGLGGGLSSHSLGHYLSSPRERELSPHSQGHYLGRDDQREHEAVSKDGTLLV
jgi:hypothetical protein